MDFSHVSVSHIWSVVPRVDKVDGDNEVFWQNQVVYLSPFSVERDIIVHTFYVYQLCSVMTQKCKFL